MSELKFPEQIINEIKSLPTAKEIAAIISRASPTLPEQKQIIDWLLTGTYNEKFLSLLINEFLCGLPSSLRFSISNENDFTPEERKMFIKFIISKVFKYEDKQNLSDQLLTNIKNRSDFPKIQKQLEIIKIGEQLFDSFFGTDDDKTLVNYLITGRNRDVDNEEYWTISYMLFPDETINNILSEVFKYSTEYFTYTLERELENLAYDEEEKDELKQEEFNKYIEELENMPEGKKFSFLMDIFGKHRPPPEPQVLFDYFNEVPAAPEAPYIPAESLLKNNST